MTTSPARTEAPADALFATARQVADAVLYEGYVLYPYRASSAKNRMRWQFGVLAPPSWGHDSGEHAHQRTECLLEPREGGRMHVLLRFLRTQRRTVHEVAPDGSHRPVAALELPDRVLVPWDEGVEEELRLDVDLAELVDGGVELPFSRPAAEETEELYDAAGGARIGRLVRRRERVDGVLRLVATELPGPYRVLRLTAEVANAGDWSPLSGEAADRDTALSHALVSAHLMLGLTAGSFVSMTDPPEWAKPAVAECRNEHTWPVLAGVDGAADVLLSSPIILEDHPRIAPESLGTLYDATEIDEILALRTATLTDQEKREARGTDARAAAVIDLADNMPPEILDRLHGAIRSLREVGGGPAASAPTAAAAPFDTPPDADLVYQEFDPFRTDTPWWDPAADASVDPGRDHVLVDGVPVRAGSRVVLRPGRRRTDAQDIFLHGRTALVEAVLHDVDGGVHVAVTVEDDPGAEIQREQGRFRYFQPDELAPVEAS
ncbi:hypothetical protein [Streptacidiphilus fuscans]|uniref:Uncharacterized protein n=1 Tax=Streptacidiphilus fuscans TaxID=2789292 RepID=A0A931B1S0_9ACTN|nr:hypothetical protein [Streptacidiphilus fuscans]MBF9068799.1 hypothetical protein [Streptacidiphilus fuscans]